MLLATIYNMLRKMRPIILSSTDRLPNHFLLTVRFL